MLRPVHPSPHDALESDDSAPTFGGGLADVLEPDADDDDDQAVTSLRHLSPPSVRHSVTRASPPSLRGRRSAPPVSVRAPAPPQMQEQVQDFAFADTVFSSGDLSDEPPPPSNPVYVNDPFGAHNNHCVTPLSFPLPPAPAEVDLTTRIRVAAAHLRNAVRRSREEMRELWAGTAEMVTADGVRPSSLQRALALWSCFQWSSADLVRAAMIGGAVFVAAATIGAVTLDFGDPAAGSSTEVRPARTLDQHTGRKLVMRAKR